MKVFLFGLFILSACISNAQWQLVYENDSCDLGTHITTNSQGKIFASGGGWSPYDGNIWISNDMGNTWESKLFYCIGWALSVPSDSVIYTGGRDGYFNKSTDGGITWVNYGWPYWLFDFNDMFFFNDSIGIIYNGIKSRTTDGGMNWELPDSTYGVCFAFMPLDFESYSRKHFSAIKDSSLYLATNGGIMWTGDMGINWHYLYCDTVKLFRSIHMFDNLFGLAGADQGKLYVTYDNWTTTSMIFDIGQEINDIEFYNDSVGMVSTGGEKWDAISGDTAGYVFYTIDRGNTWIGDKISDMRISDICFYNDTAFAIGNGTKIFRLDNIISYVTSIDEEIDQRVSIYPNPASDQINVDIPNEEFVCRIYDLNGRLVINNEGCGFKSIDISNLPSSAYILLVEGESFIKSIKIIVAH